MTEDDSKVYIIQTYYIYGDQTSAFENMMNKRLASIEENNIREIKLQPKEGYWKYNALITYRKEKIHDN